MSELPPGWDSASLGDVCEVIRGVTFPATAKEREKKSTNVCCLRTTNIQREVDWNDVYFISKQFVKRDNQLVQPGDILMSMANSYELVGKVAVARSVPYETAFGAFLSAVRPTATLYGQYLFHFLRSDYAQRSLREGSSQTTNIANISVGTLSTIPVPVAPRREQKSIADKLDALLARVDACRERLDRVPGILKRFRQSVLAAATSGELTREWREERGLDGISFERRVPLGTLCAESFYGPRFGKDEYNSGGIPTIRTTDMTRGGRIRITSDTPRVIVPKGKLEQFVVRKGDLLVTRTGSIGVMAVFDDDYVAVPSAYLIRFRFRPEVLPRFVFFCLMAPYGQVLLGLSTTAVTQPNINAEAIKRIDIPVPSIEEQSEMIRRTDELLAFADRVEARLRGGEQLVARVVPATLAKAFRGELVPQDPNDEPASKLLARLRTRPSSPDNTGKPKRGGTRGSRTKAKADTSMLTRKDVTPTHLTTILKERGSLTAEALWTASRLEIDDFYDQLKDEEARGLLRENRGDAPNAPRLLEPAA